MTKVTRLILVCAICCFSAGVTLDARTWTAPDSRTFEGAYIKQSDSTVTILRHVDDQRFTIDKSTLSKQDQEYLEEMGRLQRMLPDPESIRIHEEFIRSIQSIEYSSHDLASFAVGFLLTLWLGYKFNLPDWSFLRMIGLYLVGVVASLVSGVLGVGTFVLVDNEIIGLFLLISLMVLSTLWASARYLKITIVRLVFFYFVIGLCCICINIGTTFSPHLSSVQHPDSRPSAPKNANSLTQQ